MTVFYVAPRWLDDNVSVSKNNSFCKIYARAGNLFTHASLTNTCSAYFTKRITFFTTLRPWFRGCVDTSVSLKSASHTYHTHKRLYITLTRSHITHARFCAARRLDPSTIYSLPIVQQSWHDPAAAHSAYTKSNPDTSIVFDVRLLFYHIHYMM